MTTTTTPTSGAADLRTAAQAVVDRWDTPLWKDVPATAEYIGRLRAALAAGQATAAQAVVQDDLITLRKPTTSAELLWLLKLAHLVISDVDKTLEETFAPAQPAAQQGVAYAALPNFDNIEVPIWNAIFSWKNAERGSDAAKKAMKIESAIVDQLRAFADATHALRASQGQAPAGAVLPAGWVPLTITLEGQFSEEVAYGPQIMMDRLGKWLGKYFAQAADSVTAPAPPPECETEAEKRAFAFGWFKALESERMKAESVQEDAARVFTYKNQPCNNVTAWRFGEACRAAQPGGDPIDHGLSLLQKLQERGYGIVAIAATRKQGASHD